MKYMHSHSLPLLNRKPTIKITFIYNTELFQLFRMWYTVIYSYVYMHYYDQLRGWHEWK